jgi:ABC-type transport system substrate-binding protein
MRIIGVIVSGLMLAIAGCAAATVQRMPFPEAEYAALAKTGTGRVTGQAFMRTIGGDVKVAAGSDVALNPVTSYSQQWYDVVYVQRKNITAWDPRLDEYVMNTRADAEGRFEFVNVPPGDYFVRSLVLWAAPTGPYGSLQQQGGFVVERITVNDGEETKVIVTR